MDQSGYPYKVGCAHSILVQILYVDSNIFLQTSFKIHTYLYTVWQNWDQMVHFWIEFFFVRCCSFIFPLCKKMEPKILKQIQYSLHTTNMILG